jgi:hypothetical protein
MLVPLQMYFWLQILQIQVDQHFPCIVSSQKNYSTICSFHSPWILHKKEDPFNFMITMEFRFQEVV